MEELLRAFANFVQQLDFTIKWQQITLNSCIRNQQSKVILSL